MNSKTVPLASQSRDTSLDILKAVAIFGVVFIHGSKLLGCSSLIRETIADCFRFAVPCFIILWAFFFNNSYQKKDVKDRNRYLMNKWVYFFRLFVLWSVIYLIVNADWHHITLKNIVTTHFSGYGWGGQYYFVILLQLIVFFPIIRYLYSKVVLRYMVYFGSFLAYIILGYAYSSFPTIIHKLGDRPFVFWIIYVLIGIALSEGINVKVSRWGLCLVGLISLEFFVTRKFSLDHSAYIMPSVLIASPIIVIIFIYNPVKINNLWIQQVLTYIGRHTLIIFVSNPLVIFFFKNLLPFDYYSFSCNNFYEAFLPFISTLIITVCCLFLGYIIIKLRLERILL